MTATVTLRRTARKRHTCDGRGYYGCVGDIAPGDRYEIRTILPAAPDGRPERVKLCTPCAVWFEFSSVEEVIKP